MTIESVHRALAGCQVGLEVGGEKFYRALDWRAGHRDQVAKSLAFVEREDFAELLEHEHATLAGLNFFQHHCKAAGFHSTGGALTT